jgi:hypothetical protein
VLRPCAALRLPPRLAGRSSLTAPVARAAVHADGAFTCGGGRPCAGHIALPGALLGNPKRQHRRPVSGRAPAARAGRRSTVHFLSSERVHTTAGTRSGGGPAAWKRTLPGWHGCRHAACEAAARGTGRRAWGRATKFDQYTGTSHSPCTSPLTRGGIRGKHEHLAGRPGAHRPDHSRVGMAQPGAAATGAESHQPAAPDHHAAPPPRTTALRARCCGRPGAATRRRSGASSPRGRGAGHQGGVTWRGLLLSTPAAAPPRCCAA